MKQSSFSPTIDKEPKKKWEACTTDTLEEQWAQAGKNKDGDI